MLEADLMAERKTFARNPSPMVIGVVRERNVRDSIAAIRNCEYHGATGIDLHLSCLESDAQTTESLHSVIAASRLPILALNYNQTYDYQPFETDEESRIELLMRFVEAGGAAVDLQGYTYDLPSKLAFREEFKQLGYSFIRDNPKEIVVDPKIIEKQCELIDRIHHAGAEVLISTHPWVPMNCEQVVELALFLEKRNPDVIKIVTPCYNEEQLAECFKTMITLKKEIKTQIHFHCCGAAGSLSRIINPILGGYLVFCSDGYTASSNFEQLDLQTAKCILDMIKKIR